MCRFFGGRCPAKGHDLSEIELTIAAFGLCFGDQALNGAARKAGSFEGTLPRLFLCAIGSVGQERPASEASFQLGLSQAPAESELAGFDTTSGGTPADIDTSNRSKRYRLHVTVIRVTFPAPVASPPPTRWKSLLLDDFRHLTANIGSVSGWFQEGPREFWFGAARFTAEATTELAQACGLHRAGGLRPGLLDSRRGCGQRSGKPATV